MFFGVLAGANELAVLVDLFDTASHALLVSFTAKGIDPSISMRITGFEGTCIRARKRNGSSIGDFAGPDAAFDLRLAQFFPDASEDSFGS